MIPSLGLYPPLAELSYAAKFGYLILSNQVHEKKTRHLAGSFCSPQINYFEPNFRRICGCFERLEGDI